MTSPSTSVPPDLALVSSDWPAELGVGLVIDDPQLAPPKVGTVWHWRFTLNWQVTPEMFRAAVSELDETVFR